jgi:hypothetical protein
MNEARRGMVQAVALGLGVVVALAILLPICQGSGNAPSSGSFHPSVAAEDVLGSYTGLVTNDSDETVTLSCTIIAEGGLGSDTVTVGPLEPGETGYFEGKMALEDFTDDLTGSCAAR